MSVINLLSSDSWSEADIVNHGRAVINSQVPMERQQELQTIMLGHIAGMRTATVDELAEIGLVAQITEVQSQQNALARADMLLLQSVMTYEAAVIRLTLPLITEPATVLENEVEVPNPAIAQDVAERTAAELTISEASSEVLALFTLRNPVAETPPDETPPEGT